jgi:hypothetical protein
MLTQAILKENLHYNPETGIFTWLKRATGRPILKIAGTIDGAGYGKIMLHNKLYSSHRLAWLYISGSFPDYSIDHINGIRSDNRLVNLRLCTSSENKLNTKAQKNNTTGFKGVYATGNKFFAQAYLNRKANYLGTYKTAKEASDAYLCFAKDRHGDFFRET